MSEIAARWVSVYPKIASGFSADINAAVSKGAAQGGQAIGSGIEKGVKESAPKVGSVFKSAVAPILTVSAVAGVAQFVRGAVDQFSQLEDATAAAGVVFGGSMDKIIAKSETAAATLGMSKSQVIDAANTFGTLGKSANLSGDDLAGFSNKMTDVAGSLSSFKGGSPEEAILAVGAALRGESEPIRRYGVLLDDATLRQRALTLGIVDNVKSALTPQQRVLAAQAEILAQTGDAMGDFERTSDSTANVQKRLAAESANLSAEIGQKVAPAIVAAQKAGIGFLQFVTANQDALVPLVGTLGTLTAAVGGFVAVSKGVEALKAAKATISGLGDAFQAMGTKAKIATASAGAIGLALTGAAVIYGVFAQANADAQARVEGLTQAIKADSGAVGENSRAYAANELRKSGALTAAQKLGISANVAVSAALGEVSALASVDAAYRRHVTEIENAARARSEEAGSLADQRAAFFDSKAATSEAADAYNLLRGQLGPLADSTRDALVAEQQIADGIGDTTGAASENTGVMKTNTAAVDANADSVRKLYQARLTLRGDKRALEAAFDAATESVKENGKTLDTNTEKGRSNQDALDNIANSALAVKQAMEEQKKPTDDVNKVMGRARTAFIDAATSMGMSKEKAEKLATSLGLIKSKKVTVEAEVKQTGISSIKVVPGKSSGTFVVRAVAQGGPITGGVRGQDSVPALLMPDEHVLTTSDVANLGGHDAVYRMRALAGRGLLKFAAGGPVMPSHNGHSLDWWQDKLLSDLEFTNLQIRIRDIRADLNATETYNPPGKKKKATRLKLRGLDRAASELELADANEKMRLAQEAAAANASAAGTIAAQIAAYNEAQSSWGKQQEMVTDATAIWRSMASSLTKSGGIGSMDAIAVQHTNALGESWATKRELTAADLASRVTERAQQVDTFISLLDQLRQAGASEALISDVEALGAVAGTAAARLYLADRAQMTIANQGYAKLAAGSARLNTIAGQIAVTVNESATPEATAQAVVNGILMART